MSAKRFFIAAPEEDVEFCYPVRLEDHETIRSHVSGRGRDSTLVAVRMQLIRQDEGRRLSKSDSPWLGSHALIFRQGAVAALGSMLTDNGMLEPLNCPGETLYLFNPPHLSEALDESASSIERFPSGRILCIDRHVFRPDVVTKVDAFKIPNLRVSNTFVSDRFVERWMKAALRGLVFKEVWSNPALGWN